MRAQVTLLPTESKKLIAKALANMDIVKQALAEGLVVLHPSSSTIFVAEELTGERPKTKVWVCGVIVPKGTCVSGGAYQVNRDEPKITSTTPEDFSHSWVIEKGKLTTGIMLRELFERMGAGDVYIKGVNAVDVTGTVGVLFGNKAEAGTIGRVVAASKKKGVSLIFPVGLEKLIPVSIEKAAKEALKNQYDYAMGLNCGLFPCRGIAVNELKAIEILTGATAIPIAAGGLDGAEGAITLVIKGEEEQVSKTIKYVEECKGASLPRTNAPGCEDCGLAMCDFPMRGKHWAGSAS